jgi:hypothetical protein
MRLQILVIFAFGCATGAATSTAMKVALAQPAPAGAPRWEYSCIPGMRWSNMNALGAQGWELVTNTGGNGGDACFKRPL